MNRFLLSLSLFTITQSCVADATTPKLDYLPAFPGAEGFGAKATGGRGGRVIEVTNLGDSGPGSLRAAVEAKGPRIVLFRVAGNIVLESRLRIKNGDLTIAGQSAPGDGICLQNYPFDLSDSSNVIVRHIRVRPGDLEHVEDDALGGRNASNVIFDHCSASWSTDETLTAYKNKDITVQWCIASESLFKSAHHKGNHGYGGIWGGQNGSFHHNLLAHHSSRNPRFAPDEMVDFRNNVIYNWGFNSTYGGERGTINMVANYYKSGPGTKVEVKNRILDGAGEGGRWFVADNYIAGFPEISKDNWAGGVHRPWAPQEQMRMNTPFPFASITTQKAEDAYELVLLNAGAVLPKRDTLDERIVREARTGTATFGGAWGEKQGIIDTQSTVGGWPELKSASAPSDSDHDGMPDEWEKQQGFNPQLAADGAQDKDNDGYTNIEEYLNGTNPQQFVDYRDPKNNVDPRLITPDVKPNLVVAADGSGDFKTVQEAIDAVPVDNQKRVVISIKPGIYKSHLVVPKNKPFITLRGEDAEKTVLTNDLHVKSIGADGKEVGTIGSASVVISAPDFTAENITIENNAPHVAQALAIYVDTDRATFRNCRFLGWQDTIRVRSGRQYFDRCYINGRTDFIYGEATAFFDHCRIHVLESGWITAANTPQEQPYGLVFSNCTITGEPGIKTVLGRPWRNYAHTVWIDTTMHDVIQPAGWNNWSKPEAEATVRYAEYGSVTPDGKAIDLSTRVPWAKRLSAQEAAQYTMKSVLGDWNPNS